MTTLEEQDEKALWSSPFFADRSLFHSDGALVIISGWAGVLHRVYHFSVSCASLLSLA
jgi:hypothetical protein